ncbi:hypothetical protein ACJMK2_005851 [Sinanodonta woodiana]|uniref:Uncharacterized protein n=1 Tax=Sinanodonta woodiana TaxID=1069815 RepID=A0ABD3VUW5_SINWO
MIESRVDDVKSSFDSSDQTMYVSGQFECPMDGFDYGIIEGDCMEEIVPKVSFNSNIDVLTTPTSFGSACYYKRRINTFSLTLYNLGNSDSHSFIWNESVSGSNSCEIASCRLQIFESL